MAEPGGIHEIARACSGEAVTICDDMDELVQDMARTRLVVHNNGAKSSLLPECYATDRVVGDFHKILRQVN